MKCHFCLNTLWGDEEEMKRRCTGCAEQVEKLDEATVDWLIMVIDYRIESELDKHVDKFSHDSNSQGDY
jgi:hypothetical protein